MRLRKVGLALLVVLVWASMASANAVVPYAYYSPETVELTDSGSVLLTSPYQVFAVGVRADLGGGFGIDGSYAMGSGSLDLYGGGLSFNNRNTLRISGTYAAFEGGGFTVGPIIDYQTSTHTGGWTGIVNWTETMGGLGVGGYASADVGGVILEGSYVIRPKTALNVTVDDGGTHLESYEGTGSTLAGQAKVPVSGDLSILLGYVSDVPFLWEYADMATRASGIRIGATYSF